MGGLFDRLQISFFLGNLRHKLSELQAFGQLAASRRGLSLAVEASAEALRSEWKSGLESTLAECRSTLCEIGQGEEL